MEAFTQSQELLKVPAAQRDMKWESDFLKILPQLNLNIQPEPKMGPDSWPYLFAEISENGTEPCIQVVQWLASKGIGLVINPNRSMPDYVLSYGMLWNYLARGSFLSEVETNSAKEINLIKQQLYTAQPTETFLPPYVRDILKLFFKDQKILSPKICLLSQDQKIYDLVFSLESLASPPENEHMGICEAISWFLPSHYGVAIISEQRLEGFQEL